MALSKSGFLKAAGGGLACLAASACSPANPHQKGETYGNVAGAATIAIAKESGASDVAAVLAGLAVGTVVGGAVEETEPDCYEVVGGSQRTTIRNGYTDVFTVGNKQFICKPRAIARETVDAITGPYQRANPRSQDTRKPTYNRGPRPLTPFGRGFNS